MVLSLELLNFAISLRGLKISQLPPFSLFGILKVLEHYDLPLTSTIGFGDSMNDLEMIETCHLGIVMANGDERLKQKADIICESVKEDGIFHELKRQGLL